MNWVYNEPWRNGAGNTVVDYDGRPLMNYRFARQALSPVSISLRYDTLRFTAESGAQMELFLTSDAPSPASNLRWQWLARDRRGNVFARGEGVASIDPREVKSLGALALKPPAETAEGPLFVELRLSDHAGKLRAERMHVFRSNAPGSLAGLLGGHAAVCRTTLDVTEQSARVEGGDEVLEITVQNSGPMTALYCEAHPLIEHRTDLLIENNYCFIPPGERRTITIRTDYGPRTTSACPWRRRGGGSPAGTRMAWPSSRTRAFCWPWGGGTGCAGSSWRMGPIRPISSAATEWRGLSLLWNISGPVVRPCSGSTQRTSRRKFRLRLKCW
jgi:hypothetical protein